MNNHKPFQEALNSFSTLAIFLLIVYCFSSLMNWITGKGSVDENYDFIISFLLLIEYAKNEWLKKYE